MTLFWEDSWQQRDKLFRRLDLGEIFLFTNLPNTRSVVNYWCREDDGQWRKWKGQRQWRNAPETLQWNNFEKEMKTRKLVSANGEEIMRWGYRNKGTFTVEEGYLIKSENHQNMTVPIWKKIWGAILWPKIQHFL